MCGRYKQNTDGDALADVFKARRRTRKKDPYGLAAPGMDLPVIRENASGRFMDDLNWGFTPNWAKDDTGNRFINARSETAAEKASFRDSYRLRRCVIPADGFTEWDARTKPKTPYDITLASHAPFVFAGLWDRWTNPASGEVQDRFAVLTIAASPALAPYHDRMPVMLTDISDIDQWLSRETTRAALEDIAARSTQQRIDIRPADDPRVMPKAAESPKDTRQGDLF